MKLRTNEGNPDLWCLYSKERIEIGERYVIIQETYGGEVIEKTYKVEYAPTQEELEDTG